MTLPLLQIDAFTSEPFAGNPAAVCFLDREPHRAHRLSGVAPGVAP
jgi:predicted PhzF superfamily epimerase YddE/YHI9